MTSEPPNIAARSTAEPGAIGEVSEMSYTAEAMKWWEEVGLRMYTDLAHPRYVAMAAYDAALRSVGILGDAVPPQPVESPARRAARRIAFGALADSFAKIIAEEYAAQTAELEKLRLIAGSLGNENRRLRSELLHAQERAVTEHADAEALRAAQTAAQPIAQPVGSEVRQRVIDALYLFESPMNVDSAEAVADRILALIQPSPLDLSKLRVVQSDKGAWFLWVVDGVTWRTVGQISVVPAPVDDATLERLATDLSKCATHRYYARSFMPNGEEHASFRTIETMTSVFAGIIRAALTAPK